MPIEFDNDEYNVTYNDTNKEKFEKKKGPISKLLIRIGFSKNRKQAEFVLTILALAFFFFGMFLLTT